MFAQAIAVATFLLLAALVTGLSTIFGRWYISMPMIFVLFGMFFGPQSMKLIYEQPEKELVQLLAELTLALVLFADASTLHLNKVSDDVKLPGRLLVFALPMIILAGALVGKMIFPSMGFPYLLLLAAILAPTDASLGLPIYTNPRMPVRIRNALNVESGLNDGIASPLVVLFLGMTLSTEGVMLGSWLTEAFTELGLAILIGIIAGYIGGRFLETAVSRKWTNDMWSKLSVLAFALACYFFSIAVGGNGFVAAFVGGIMFGHVSKHKLTEQTEFIESGGTLLSMVVWTIFAALYASPYLEAGAVAFAGRAILYAILSLTFVRMLPVAISMIGTGLRLDTVLLMGWFGPRGLASVVFGLLAVIAFEDEGLSIEPLASVISVTVILSVFAHGISARPLVNWYANRLEQAEQADVELAEVPELPSRRTMHPTSNTAE